MGRHRGGLRESLLKFRDSLSLTRPTYLLLNTPLSGGVGDVSVDVDLRGVEAVWMSEDCERCRGGRVENVEEDTLVICDILAMVDIFI